LTCFSRILLEFGAWNLLKFAVYPQLELGLLDFILK